MSKSVTPNTSPLPLPATKSGTKANELREACLKQVLNNPGQTAVEIAQTLGMDRSALARRLPELRNAGLVKNGEERTCSITKRLSLTWLPAQEVQ